MQADFHQHDTDKDGSLGMDERLNYGLPDEFDSSGMTPEEIADHKAIEVIHNRV